MNDIRMTLDLFDDAGSVVNTTEGWVNAGTGAGEKTGAMSPTMKTYYNTELLENARPKLIFSQLGKQQFLPENHGETVQWRKFNTFAKALQPLQEGVIPAGQKFGMSKLEVSLHQHGTYAAISDRLEMHAVDNTILACSEEMGASGGETADTLTRNELTIGTNVLYADKVTDGVPVSTPVGRYEMKADNNRLTPDTINRAYTNLKKNKAPYFEGNKYVAVIHPSVSYDLRSHKDWIEVHKYAATTEIFNGEIGELHGVRFVETTEAPIFLGASLFSDAQQYLTVSAYSTSDTTATAQFGVPTAYKITVAETLTDAIAEKLVGREIHYYDESAGKLVGSGVIVGATKTGGYVWIEEAAPVTLVGTSDHEDLLYPGEGGDVTSGPCAIYATLFFGKDAFGVVEPEGMGMEMIIKPKEQAGGPLNQFSTVGYKFETAARILYQERMLRVESCSAYSTVDEAN